MVKKKRIQQDIGYQIIFWVGLFLFGIAKNYGQYDGTNFKEIIIYEISHWIFQIAAANFIYYVLIEYFFNRKKYLLFSLSLVVSLYAISVVNRIFIVYGVEPLFMNYPKDSFYDIFTDLNYLLFHYVFSIIIGAFIFIATMFMLRYRNEKENAARLLKEKAELELKALKSQLNPHFLFNTLNNIYALSLTNSERTSESIHRLSDILDYILYKGQRKTVLISDELEIINDYVELEKLRYDERLKVRTFEKLESSNTIPPLLFLSLVENAFKHGAGKTSGEAEIHISAETNKIHSVLKVENTFNGNNSFEKEGLGLKNIKEQLKLYFDTRFELTTTKENNWFTITITIPAHHD
ncbi:histidine kinase [Chryseobacterium sp. YIM B02567]|uniref:Histidine kinase n=2 Tax=Chryseobacterium paridis TaxID=2800328 RepID=A0ABS1FQW3_9FLAO|nr:histidine kinase [Chryseobacterium paridis]